MLAAWRIVPERWSATAFDGEGARLYGGRWNSPGGAAIYVAESRALAALETLVHYTALPETRFVRYEVRFAKSLIETVTLADVREFVTRLVIAPETQSIGDRWLAEARKPVLEVPSAIIPEEKNYLLNPLHPKFSEVEIGTEEIFAFDPRLVNPT